MSDARVKGRPHGHRWMAGSLLLLLIAGLLGPFLLTTQLARLALARSFPGNSPRLGRATLGISGTLVLRDLVLHDTRVLARRPLLSVHEVDATFRWTELISRRIRRVRARGVVVHAGADAASLLSLLNLFSGPARESGRGAPWIDTLDVRGTGHPDTVAAVAPGDAKWPLRLRMTTSGDRRYPTRRLRLVAGNVERLPASSAGAITPRPALHGAFGVRAEVSTRPTAGRTRVVLHRLAAREVTLTIDAGMLRQYVPALPAALEGRIEADLGALDASGRMGSGSGQAMGFGGTIQVRDLSVRAPAGEEEHALVLDGLTASGTVETPLGRWAPAAVTVRDGVTRWKALAYGKTTFRDLDVSWRIGGRRLSIERGAVQVFGGHVSGSPVWDLVDHTMPPWDLRITGIDMHQALANVSPEHLDAEGTASGLLHLERAAPGDLSGHLELAFDGPGILRIGGIEQLDRMLAGNFGLALASMAASDLRQYPFEQGKVYLESSGRDAQLKIAFVRQPRDDADARPPHKQIINGQEVWVGSLVVPTIDMTIPITGRSLAEILSIVGGVHPVIDAAGEQPGR